MLPKKNSHLVGSIRPDASKIHVHLQQMPSDSKWSIKTNKMNERLERLVQINTEMLEILRNIQNVFVEVGVAEAKDTIEKLEGDSNKGN